MLTIKEAAPYYNIGQKKLRRMAEDNLGVFPVYSGNRYLIIRSKFEEFILEFFGDLDSFYLPKVVAI